MSIFRSFILLAFTLGGSAATPPALAAQAPHPTEMLFQRFSSCLGHSLFRDAAKYAGIDLKGRWRDDARYWRTGDPDFVNANPNDGRYEVYRAEYDRVRHIVVIKHDMYEGAEVIVSAGGPFSFSNADLSDAIPIRGLSLGQTKLQVERVLGRGFRQDRCGKEQYYYYSQAASFLVLTYYAGRLVQFFGGFYTD